MASFIVNGQEVSPSKNQKLLRFLRDELHITSAKDGCSEGACGACTVIIDGQTCKSCVPDTDSLSGKNVITVEGLSDWEQKVYTYAYGKAGAGIVADSVPENEYQECCNKVMALAKTLVEEEKL